MKFCAASKWRIMSKSISQFLTNQYLRSHNEENSVKIYSIALCSEVLSCLHMENHVKISFLVLCNSYLKRHKEKIHVKILFLRSATLQLILWKIMWKSLSWCCLNKFWAVSNFKWKIMSKSFIVPSYHILSRLKLENQFKISFLVLCNEVLSRLEVVKSCQNTFHIVGLRWKMMSKKCSYSALQPCFEPLWYGKSCQIYYS